MKIGQKVKFNPGNGLKALIISVFLRPQRYENSGRQEAISGLNHGINPGTGMKAGSASGEDCTSLDKTTLCHRACFFKSLYNTADVIP